MNSSVYACFGIFIISAFQSNVILRHPWKTKFRGNLNLDAKTGTKDSNYVDASKRGTQGKTCLPEKKSDEVEGTGKGADAIIAFRPERWSGGTPKINGREGPGSAADEILIHELVHASRIVRGVRNSCFGAPRGWNDYEEFVAITLCNVFSSENNRGLRFGHSK
ncbi:MAG: hypothetical protein V9G98_25745 [Candidatus Competibacter sp.]